ncbi:DinB family protein [Calycomorphotria hydatis]|uniref:DinB superfamily protein n=1 Tax=Calycomorphotria hydatis TaxID=2528027 RepID=A0A517TCX8_9PLAN|nr:DinB family protein [Calycomorphotria hydatis]QDT66222.1 DinB superfamily protein [Calycomorphotria hydatis]
MPANFEPALATILTELTQGAESNFCWVLNPNDAGLIPLLRSLNAEAAQSRPAPDRKSIAEHAHHLRYSVTLLNRWAGGEENPFATADWAGSWVAPEFSDNDWQQFVNDFEQQLTQWAKAVTEPREWDQFSLPGALASAAHVAYHFGAVRQLVLSLKNN